MGSYKDCGLETGYSIKSDAIFKFLPMKINLLCLILYYNNNQIQGYLMKQISLSNSIILYKISFFICFILVLINYSNSQIARDIALKYLYLDTNKDNLVSSYEIRGLNQTQLDKKLNEDKLTGNQNKIHVDYYYWRKYLTYQYPSHLFDKYDANDDDKLSVLQFNQIVKAKIKKFSVFWADDHFRLLATLKTQDYLVICDTDQDGFIGKNQFLTCFQALLVYEFQHFPYRIKSLLFPNRTIGYSLSQFTTLFPPSKKQQAAHQIETLFDSFEWPQQKIKQDVDTLIGPEQGKFMEPTILYFYLDTNWDEVLDKQEAMKYFRKFGGDKIWALIDFNADNVIDQAQLVSYLMFAMCIQDCEVGKDNRQKCELSGDEKSMINQKYQTKQAVCHVLQGLKQINKQILSQQSKKKQDKTQQQL